VRLARRRYPEHTFLTLDEFQDGRTLPGFDVIVALAVIEHVDDPGDWLARLAAHLNPGGRIVLTTPHPAWRRVHDLGAAVGLFSREAAEEHHALLDEPALRELATNAGLDLIHSRRFLLGANQLFVLRPAQSDSPTRSAARTPPPRLAAAFGRFGLLAVVSALLSFGLTIGLHELAGVPAYAAYAVALVVTFLVNFAAMRYAVFVAHTGSARGQLALHGLTAISFRAGEYAAFLLLHSCLGLHYVLAMVAIQGLSFLGKFFVYRNVVFRLPAQHPCPGPATA
ncbi:MAG: methyltransferase domain-containing protein, partial [Phycisphaerae bacterium]|nr:methyltransferase domain-containing protein [Phycisphaerae bacterium]